MENDIINNDARWTLSESLCANAAHKYTQIKPFVSVQGTGHAVKGVGLLFYRVWAEPGRGSLVDDGV